MPDSPERWIKAAEALELGIPEERVAAVAPILEGLMASARKALDRDLSLIEPVTVFRPQRERGGKG